MSFVHLLFHGMFNLKFLALFLGRMHLPGLVDAKSEEDFEMSLATLPQKWRLHDLEETSGPISRFCDWFYTHKAKMLKENVITTIRVKAESTSSILYQCKLMR